MRAGQSISVAAPAADMGASRPIDHEHLRRYTLGDPGLELEILGLFAAQLPITLGILEHATTDKDWGMGAHTLKGSARAVGAWPLATLAEDAERLTANADSDMRAAILRRLEAAAKEARAYIAALALDT